MAGRRPKAEDVAEFEARLEEYKAAAGRPFPTWSEVLEVAKSLGWRKVAPPEPPPRGGVRAGPRRRTGGETRMKLME